MWCSVLIMKVKRVRAALKTASTAAPKLLGQRWKSQMSWQTFAEVDRYGQEKTRERSSNPIPFLARPPAWRRAGEDRRFLGILPSYATGPRICSATHRRNGGAPSRDR